MNLRGVQILTPPTARGLPTARGPVPDSPTPRGNRPRDTTISTAHRRLRANERVRVVFSLTRRRAVGMMSTSTGHQRPRANDLAHKEPSNLISPINRMTIWAGRERQTANDQTQPLQPTKAVGEMTRVLSRSTNRTRTATWVGARPPTVSETCHHGGGRGGATVGGIKMWNEGTGRDTRADMHDRPEHDKKIPAY